MAWAYNITSITAKEDSFRVCFVLLKDDVEFRSAEIMVPYYQLKNCASDKRLDFIKSAVAGECQRYMVVDDVKSDFSSIIGQTFPLDGIRYMTALELETAKAELDALRAQ